MFKPLSGEVDPAPAVLAELVRCSVGRDDSADAFYYGALGKNSAPLYADEAVSKLLEDGVKKYSSDKRSAEVAKRLAAAKPAKK